ncbi:hypothetical protein [Gracilibacillus lacisalsi]|uniref:hypothetical protein n=1 Tax=Gracilibacillus lacisalsi TaxID=393087 RepID=UPI00035F5A5C|nr:hypothetical protein [Gracilibacillus lacisalsi]
MSNKWQEKADETRNLLKRSDGWVIKNYSDLPDEVKEVLAAGKNAMRDSIDTYERYARWDAEKAE